MKKARASSTSDPYWDKKLLEVEAKDPNRLAVSEPLRRQLPPVLPPPRWRHSGYKSLYMDGSSSPSPGRRSRSRSLRRSPRSPPARRSSPVGRRSPRSPPPRRPTPAGSGRRSPPPSRRSPPARRPRSPPPPRKSCRSASASSVSSCSDDSCSVCSPKNHRRGRSR